MIFIAINYNSDNQASYTVGNGACNFSIFLVYFEKGIIKLL